MARNKKAEQAEAGDSGIDLVQVAPPIIAGVILLAFFIANTESTEVNLLIAKVEAPLIVVLVITALLGAVMGSFVGRRRRRG